MRLTLLILSLTLALALANTNCRSTFNSRRLDRLCRYYCSRYPSWCPNRLCVCDGTTTTTTTTTANPGNSDDCVCGDIYQGSSNRIVAGEESGQHHHPWQVALVGRNSNFPFCGGAILGERIIATAAHCVNTRSPSQIQVMVGEHDWTTSRETVHTVRHNIRTIYVNPSYDSRRAPYDNAILILSEPIHLDGPGAHRVCLPTNTAQQYVGVRFNATGWGRVMTNGGTPARLRQVELVTISNTQCRGTYGSNVDGTVICADLANSQAATCNGDSGGPWTYNNQGTFELIGLTSFGSITGCSAAPSAGSRVTSMLNFIASISETGYSVGDRCIM